MWTVAHDIRNKAMEARLNDIVISQESLLTQLVAKHHPKLSTQMTRSV